MRKTLEGSSIDRGRKNRRNMKKQVARKPTMLAQIIRRRTLLTGVSGLLSMMGPVGFADAGSPAALDAVGDGGADWVVLVSADRS